MGLRLKFNLVLSVVFLIGLVVTGMVSRSLLQQNARAEVVRNAELMMESALAIRAYTVSHVKPLLDVALLEKFLPETVPAFAATETLNKLKDKYPDYIYKEATLNPINPRDRAMDWEADLIQAFRNSTNTKFLVGERDSSTGRMLYIAHPIQIKNAACLACHHTPETSPPTMLQLYGPANGFGWKLDESKMLFCFAIAVLSRALWLVISRITLGNAKMDLRELNRHIKQRNIESVRQLFGKKTAGVSALLAVLFAVLTFN